MPSALESSSCTVCCAHCSFPSALRHFHLALLRGRPSRASVGQRNVTANTHANAQPSPVHQNISCSAFAIICAHSSLRYESTRAAPQPQNGVDERCVSTLIGRHDDGRRDPHHAFSLSARAHFIFVCLAASKFSNFSQSCDCEQHCSNSNVNTNKIPPWPPSTSNCRATTVRRRSRRARRGISSVC